MNGFNDGDWPLGTMESPTFTISDDYINLLVGGGRHPHVTGSQLSNDPPAGRTVFDFELPEGQTLADSGWEITGDFASEPRRNPSTAGGDYFLGAKRLNTWEGGPRGDDNVGLMTSPVFALDGDFVSFLIGGGKRADGSLQAELVIDGEVVRAQTGPESGQLNWRSWDVSEFAGSQAQLRVRDEATGGFGHLTFDHVVVGDEPAKVRSDETSVNLVVDGEIVRSATGADSETLDWASWNVKEFEGREASIRVIDNNRFGWGHILLDQVMFARYLGAHAARELRLAGLGPRLLRERDVFRHPEHVENHAGLDEQLGLRQRHPHVDMAQFHGASPRGHPRHDTRRSPAAATDRRPNR